jgi:shikimate 5-dehydrogenase
MDGIDLLVEQAAGQYSIMTGREPSRETMRAAARDRLGISGAA